MLEFYKALYASWIAKGCNIGMTKMASLAPGIGTRTFQRMNEIYLQDDTMQRVIEQLAGAVHALPIAGLMGDETVSMSDGMQICTRVRAMNASFMPEHFPPGQRAITYYWHVSHQGPGYGAHVFGND